MLLISKLSNIINPSTDFVFPSGLHNYSLLLLGGNKYALFHNSIKENKIRQGWEILYQRNTIYITYILLNIARDKKIVSFPEI